MKKAVYFFGLSLSALLFNACEKSQSVKPAYKAGGPSGTERVLEVSQITGASHTCRNEHIIQPGGQIKSYRYHRFNLTGNYLLQNAVTFGYNHVLKIYRSGTLVKTDVFNQHPENIEVAVGYGPYSVGYSYQFQLYSSDGTSFVSLYNYTATGCPN